MRARALAVVVVTLMLWMQTPATADYGGYYGGSNNAIVISGELYAGAGGAAASGYEYSVTRLPCTTRVFDAEGDPRCVEATCPGSPPDDASNQWRYAQVERRLAGSGGPWEVVGTSCLNFAVIAPQVTPEMARELMLQLLPVLDFGFQPAGETVVNLPVIVYTDQTREWTFPPDDLLGQAVLIRSQVTAYTWSFDGVEMTTEWPGRPFADDCERVPCDGYVSYPFPARGTFAIGLTVTWTGEFSVNGGAWQPVPGDGTTVSPTQNVTVLEAHAVLTDPYD